MPRAAALVLFGLLSLLGARAAWSAGGGAVPVLRAAELPPEARETLQLIGRGGPFPYPRDGAVFGNYEHRLPEQPHGHYHEYTVKTPGEHGRGARRIVCGPLPECYYTADHYNSFRRIGP